MAFSIIIPSKSAANLVPCVRAIREAGETARIIVVDDGIDWFTAGAEDQGRAIPLQIVPGVKPFCFSRNINIGIRAAGEDDVILLNDDALLKTWKGFSSMAGVASIKSFGNYGLVAASCDTVGNPNQHCRANQTHPEGLLRDERRMVCFVCVFIPRSTINTVGLLDENLIHYGMDDDDYCLRVRNAGLKLGIFDGCFVDHGSLKSSFRGGPQAGGDFTANMRIFIEKWGVDNWGRGRAASEFRHLFPDEVMK